jgi:hypothetical protein
MSSVLVKFKLNQRVTKPGDYRVGVKFRTVYGEVGKFIRLRMAW